jgi:antirestriction protein ArdC
MRLEAEGRGAAGPMLSAKQAASAVARAELQSDHPWNEGQRAAIASTGSTIRIYGDSAHYTPSTDTITMPDGERFFGTETASAEQNWYAILLHEIVHWTGADHRLARTFGKRLGRRLISRDP